LGYGICTPAAAWKESERPDKKSWVLVRRQEREKGHQNDTFLKGEAQPTDHPFPLTPSTIQPVDIQGTATTLTLTLITPQTTNKTHFTTLSPIPLLDWLIDDDEDKTNLTEQQQQHLRNPQ
jgi:hypothetical protein